ncbi:MAG: aminotransferase class III-fold pyridoxal phosphate-dependent enzyme [Candidatus Peribacteraceae bacterium]|nr:aminotransferase class III-fold pyridoxal phosphate-dependent enzyme [Candidatus Peribacteraceae bacterium]
MAESDFSAGFYSDDALAIVGGDGATVVDSEGKKYIDCVGGHGVANLGHGNKKIAAAVSAAWENFAFATARHPHPIREKFLAKLAEKMPFENPRFFLSNSGTESVEAAIKIARLATGRTKILAAKRAFHGRTLGALSATWRPEFREPFEPLVPDFDFFAFNKVDSLAEKIDDQTAAVILETVQGEGGIFVAEKEFLAGVRELCDQHGALLILDEVQSGICRTGKFCAFENFGGRPDIICMAKSLAGGYPLGATAFRGDLLADKNARGAHASTFGGSVPACAAGLAALEFCDEENLAEQAKEKGEFLKAEIEKIGSPKISEIRGIGLMLAIDFKVPAGEIVKKLEEEGVLVLPTGPKTIRLLPPIVITKEEMGEVVEKTNSVLK